MMTEPTPTRKSGRQRVPNRKYQDDAFETLKVVLSSDSEDEEILEHQQLLQDDSDEFPANNLPDDHDDEDDSLADSASDGSELQTPLEEYEDAHSYASSDSGDLVALGVPRFGRHRPKANNLNRYVNVHCRGMPENPLKQDYSRSVLKLFSGEGVDDIIHVSKARDRWAADPTLPARSALCAAASHEESRGQMEATIGWEWYYDQGGRQIFAERQNIRLLTPAETLDYHDPQRINKDFLIGPYGRQTKHSIAVSDSISLDQAWSYAAMNDPQVKQRRPGWILNVGERIKGMDWVPNQNGKTQYLALSTARPKERSTTDPPAFQSVPGPAIIQIWSLCVTTKEDIQELAFLHSLLCADWGEIRQLKWCPVPRTTRMPTTSASSFHPDNFTGLLAMVCGDGSARVVSVEIDPQGEVTTTARALKYQDSGFAARASAGNPCTCLTWLSSTDLAVGYANGKLAVYDICPEAKPNSPGSPRGGIARPYVAQHGADPIPWLSMPLHSTYILALNSAYPTHPLLLLSSSLDGYIRLTSLLAPKTDYVISSRTRSPPTSLAYCDPLLSVIGAEESNETVKVWGLRCFYVSFACARLPASPAPGPNIVDVGKCHSSVAIGSADGSVLVTNPIRKILGRKQVGYQQCVFRHEWRRTPEAQADAGNPQYTSGISRFTEGYKAEKVNLNTRNSVRKAREMVSISTIYENETAVTSLAWNPNVSCGGLLAVGWGSGLVRIQDIASD